ncbi:hypothetical protein [Nocardia sp. CC227C]|uniref:hypothetical protein n=1 Tax=Nocardia sp. CC227C TaxID=3044562 RepID=UPI00278BCB38|nr:hypothetical protein [Nocardia sp. CC227C]
MKEILAAEPRRDQDRSLAWLRIGFDHRAPTLSFGGSRQKSDQQRRKEQAPGKQFLSRRCLWSAHHRDIDSNGMLVPGRSTWAISLNRGVAKPMSDIARR